MAIPTKKGQKIRIKLSAGVIMNEEVLSFIDHNGLSFEDYEIIIHSNNVKVLTKSFNLFDINDCEVFEQKLKPIDSFYWGVTPKTHINIFSEFCQWAEKNCDQFDDVSIIHAQNYIFANYRYNDLDTMKIVFVVYLHGFIRGLNSYQP